MARKGQRRRGVRGPARAVAPAAQAVTRPTTPPLSSKTVGTANTAVARALAGGRATVQQVGGWPTAGVPQWIEPRPDDGAWRVESLHPDDLAVLPPHAILDILVNQSPDVSRAYYDFLRMANPEWNVVAYRPGTVEVDPRGAAAIGAFFDRLIDLYGAVDVVFERLFGQLYLRGAVFMELVLDAGARLALDLATPDPLTVRFARRDDPQRGQVWSLGQQQARGFVDLSDRPTVRYIPLDPLPSSPYGRPIAGAAIFSALFLLAVLHDTKRIIQQQGWPRIDIAIDFAALMAAMPADAEEDPEEFARWVDANKDQVIAAYNNLQPTDAYVHASTIAINKPIGVDATALGGIADIIGALERFLLKGTKSMPMLMGATDGVSEANANRQLEIYLLGIRANQHLLETGLEWLLGLALRAQGIAADVLFRFAENRAAEELRDMQVLQLRIANARALYDSGYIDQDEAAQLAIGHNAAEREPKAPIAPTGGPGLVNGSVKPDNATGSGDNKQPEGKPAKPTAGGRALTMIAGLAPAATGGTGGARDAAGD